MPFLRTNGLVQVGSHVGGTTKATAVLARNTSFCHVGGDVGFRFQAFVKFADVRGIVVERQRILKR